MNVDLTRDPEQGGGVIRITGLHCRWSPMVGSTSVEFAVTEEELSVLQEKIAEACEREAKP